MAETETEKHTPSKALARMIRDMMSEAIPEGMHLRVRVDSEGRRKAQIVTKEGREWMWESFRGHGDVEDRSLEKIAERLDYALERKRKADHLRGKAKVQRELREAAEQAGARLARTRFLDAMPDSVKVVPFVQNYHWQKEDLREIKLEVDGLTFAVSLRAEWNTGGFSETNTKVGRVYLKLEEDGELTEAHVVRILKKLGRKS